MLTIRELVEKAKAVALEAGDMLRERRQNLKEVREELAHDFKTEADHASETLIRERLEELGLPIIGEEYGGEAPKGDELYWVVDPLDGTVNYVHGLPMSTVSIGLMRGEAPVGGAVYDFWHNKLYWAAEGEGAWVNDEKIEPKYYEKRGNQVFNKGTSCLPEHLELAKDFMQPRNIWCGSMQICYTAEGVFGGTCVDAFYLWDWAGATALIRELGYHYKATKLDDKPHHYRFECYRELAN